MGLKDRAQAELTGNKEISTNGERRQTVQVRHSGLSAQEAEKHDWVADAFVIDDTTIELVVKYESKVYFTSTD